PLESWLKARLNAKDGIDYVPFLPSFRQVAEAYNQAKVVVCASFAEGGPRFVVEAMACGLPAVSTPVGLMGEIIKNGETGFLLQSWSPQEMAEKIAALLESAELYRRCSERAIQVASRFDYQRVIAEYAFAYQRLLEA
ncbi:MAG: glycosyltransferase family 4 protein, partial [Gammaproteobacteria bacterium]